MKRTTILMKTFLLCALLAGSIGAWADYSSSTVGTTTTLTWDFAEFTTTSVTNPDNYNYQSIYFKGGTDNETLTKGGFRINGNTGSGTRNASYTPAYNGTMTVYAKANGNSNSRYVLIATAQSAISAAPTVGNNNCVAASKDLNGSDADKDHFSVALTSGTTYYIEAYQGITITKIVYEYTVAASNEPTSTNVNPSTGTIAIGGTVQLAGSFGGGTFTGEWVSDNTGVATVSSTGLVTGVAAGTAHVTYQWKDDQSKDAYKATATITVLPGFSSEGYNKVADFDFKAMPNTEFTTGSSIGKIHNSGNSANQDILPVTTEGFEYLAIQAAFSSSDNKGWKIVNGSGLYEGSGAERAMAIRNLKSNWVVEVYHTSGTNFYTKNDGSDDGIEKTPLIAESGHHVFRADEAGMMGFNLTKGKYVTRIVVWTTTDPDATVSYSNTGADGGIAPEGMDLYGLFPTITLPAVNQTLSKADYTQTGWTDGENNYTMGQTITAPATNTTYTPVFTANSTSLDRSESATAVTWNFRNSAISLNMQGTTGYYVKQAKVNGMTIDVPMYLNTTSGKLNNQNRDDEWIQANNGTTLTIPAVKGMQISFGKTRYAFSSTTIAGTTEYTKSGSSEYNYTASYTYNGEASTIDIVIGNDISYMTTITVNYPIAVTSPVAPVEEGEAVILTTSDNMAGWRAFYDASNSYSVDANTKVYVADADPEGDVIKLKSIEGVPANVPVLLHTTSSADNYKMTLTKETVSPFSYTGTNNLTWTTSAVSSKYRLGFGASGVGFYPYSGTPASGAVILNVSSAASRLAIVFDDETTGIDASLMNNEEIIKSGEVYNLNGQLVATPSNGIYIVNGKKVIIK